jgi:hypothetical protein
LFVRLFGLFLHPEDRGSAILRNVCKVYMTTRSTPQQTVYFILLFNKTKLNSIVWVRGRTIPTERPLFVGEVIVNFLRIEGATWSAWRIPTAVFSVF